MRSALVLVFVTARLTQLFEGHKGHIQPIAGEYRPFGAAGLMIIAIFLQNFDRSKWALVSDMMDE
jgi:hypothetical protein